MKECLLGTHHAYQAVVVNENYIPESIVALARENPRWSFYDIFGNVSFLIRERVHLFCPRCGDMIEQKEQ